MKKTLLLLSIFLAAQSPLLPETIRQLDKKIRSNKQDLDQVQGRLKSLEGQKEALKREEEGLKKSLNRISSDIEWSQKKRNSLAERVRSAENQIRQTEQQIAFLSGEKVKWEESILRDVKGYYVSASSPRMFQAEPVGEYARKAFLLWESAKLKDAEVRKDSSLKREKELLESRQKYSKLEGQLGKEIQKKKLTEAEKKKQHELTASKREQTEKELQELQETSASLEKMLSGLMRRKEETLEAQRESERQRRAAAVKKGTYPWPAQGPIVVPYGKNKHPELGITVFNNGVRIRTAPSEPVRSVEKGKVVYAKDFRSYGQTVIVDHGGDCYSIYGLLDKIAVRTGVKVKTGDVLGQTASAANSLLYFEFRIRGKAEDPGLWLK